MHFYATDLNLNLKIAVFIFFIAGGIALLVGFGGDEERCSTQGVACSQATESLFNGFSSAPGGGFDDSFDPDLTGDGHDMSATFLTLSMI
ncbi:MAG: hypothetical protein CVV44_07515 [Spirochaetae bacterium HGW-Spirochaetae-1]|nr:MAG: hypothetical protein CVV44_07515 [Spirochaetae bacterium HGW-Spirochaetae-1]